MNAHYEGDRDAHRQERDDRDQDERKKTFHDRRELLGMRGDSSHFLIRAK